MNDLTTYRKIQPRMRGGDILFFHGGDTKDVVSIIAHALPNAIEAATRSNLSHTAMILDYRVQGELMMVESTIHGKVNGPQINPVAQRISEYDGSVWWAPLSDRVRGMLDFDAMWKFTLAKVGPNHYGIRSLFHFLIRKVPLVGSIPYFHRPEKDAEVCSELCAESLRAGGLPGIDTHEVSPQKLAEMRLYGDCVQLAGSPARIRNFNTV